MTISWRVGAFLAFGMIPLFFFPTVEMLIGWVVFVAAVTLVDVFAAVNPRTFTYSRTVNSPIRADQQTASTVTVASPNGRQARVSVRDAWPPSVHPHPHIHHGHIDDRSPLAVVTTLAPERRGIRRADYVSIRVWGPLGLGARQISVDVPATVDVLPEFRSRKLLPSRVARLQEIEGSTAVILRGSGSEFDSLRDYVRGDDPRDIDWRASARAQDLVVRTWQPERDRHVHILLDTGRTSALLLTAAKGPRDGVQTADTLDIGTAPRLDAGIETALLMAGLADRAGDHVHVTALDRRVHMRISKVKGPELLKSLAHGMRDVFPSVEPIDWTLVDGEIRRTLRHRSLVILVTQIPSAGADPELVEFLTRLRRTHTVMVVSAQDPALLDTLDERDTPEHIHESASVASQLQADAQGVAELQRLGITTVCVEAGLLAARTADTYIDMKKRGLL